MSRRVSSLVFVLLVPACSNVPTFPQFGDDAGIECGREGLECPSGEVCLSGHCYASCTTTSCGPLESCVSGICVPRTGDGGMDAGRDAPMVDAPDPCAGVTCDGATPYCRRGVCVPCTEVMTEEQCGLGTPICQVSRNTCVGGTTGALCEPCNDAPDCTEGRLCVSIGTTALERVCLPACAAGCPTGTACDTGLGACRPVNNASCLQLLASRAGTTCTTDDECAPFGATLDDGLFVGSCAGTCRFPCGSGTDCVSGTCDGATGFCN